MVHYSDELTKVNYSEFIIGKYGYIYAYLANIFFDGKGVTLQQFINNHKIERVKELLFHNEFNLTEISNKLHYSGVADLSNQFKKKHLIFTILFKGNLRVRKS
jgi:AraC-like DNA-binding protein